VEAPQYPAGPHAPEGDYGSSRRAQLIEAIANAPAALRAAVSGLTATQLETRYRNWTIRQIVHHIADSHLNAYIRFKLALTEDRPTIKPYNEGLWVGLADTKTGDIQPTLDLLEALHARWVTLLRGLTAEQFGRAYFHPEAGASVRLSEALSEYAWHGRHHTGQVLWLRRRHSWT
jgi:uncharacterized damage-inducible protein DinB